MRKEFKEGFLKGMGLTAGLLAIPIAGFLFFGVYRVLELPVKRLLRSQEMNEYFDCSDKYMVRVSDRLNATVKGFDVPARLKMCERPTRKWKWQPKDN